MKFSRLHSWWDVNLFVLRTLRPPKRSVVIFSIVMFIIGVILWLRDLDVGAWFAVIFGFLNLLRDALLPIKPWFDSPNAKLVDDDEVPKLLSKIKLDKHYLDKDYKIFKLPFLSNQYVVRSFKIDSFLRSHDVELKEDKTFLNRIDKKLQEDSDKYETTLRCKYRQSWRKDTPQGFVNEVKVCLGEDLLNMDGAILIYKATYFHSFLTNEFVTLALKSGNPYTTISQRGSSQFPTFKNVNDKVFLKPVFDSLMSNHIGVSTLAHTSDGKLVFWRQSEAAQHSPNLMAPPGSGSCDWSDWINLSGDPTLNNLFSRAAEREFQEESLPRNLVLKGEDIKTEVLGFFRWVYRGGKPEFVGITKINVSSHELVPNKKEVEKPDDVQLTYPAETFEELCSSVKILLKDQEISVPLRVNLECLVDALKEDPGRWKAFLDI